ncbi:MAG: hypothetical protein RLY57_450 [Candidatus Parcubacteria bacterium]|jgi:uncharacterized membrane-anchored protein
MSQQNKHQFSSLLSKVPEITIFFWIIKVLCTTVGETFADFLDVNLNIGLTGTSVLMGILLTIVLFFQFRSKRYTPVIYWLTVALVSVFGTLVTDNLTDSVGVPLETSVMLFSALLGITFVLWYISEKTLSIHSITTKKREVFYWCTILFTFALGTAAGDLMAESLGLGYALTGIIVAAIILLFSVSRRLGLNSILSFWMIYIMTRPLGASIGDYISQPNKYGGIGLGSTSTSIIFILGIILLVIYLTYSKKDTVATKTLLAEEKEKGGLYQTIITLVLFLAVSVYTYSLRQQQLTDDTKVTPQINPTTTHSIQNLPESSAKTEQNNPLGDLSAFKIITTDIKNFVNQNNLSAAKNRADDLEYEWDNAESHLKVINKQAWIEVDDAIDAVLRQIRSVHPNITQSITALDTLITILK